MSDRKAIRFLASQYASIAAHGPLDASRRRDAGFTLDALEALELVDAADAAAWRARLGRLAVDAAEQPLLPQPVREAARSYLAEETDDRRHLARHALESVGALTWRDASDAHTPRGLIVDRVIAAPAQPPAELTIASIVLFADVVQVYWYDQEPPEGVQRPQAGVGRGGPFGLTLEDDVGTQYTGSPAGSSGGRGRVSSGRTAFTPAPPTSATWLAIVDRGTSMVRIPLT